ncbi:Holliday junction branch migration protein RuvA [Cerasicoccus arenae]|uniref:Holliday junction branch migration complex subunit RuvA n=1 Tax=Cerasicoccus arenae TaxID=424488 RepID=A0A8J3DGZ5_9BACT|nr:Holliday junction branch migration protein RuvA [Cerasicoccus arenae]MBK1856694.1 Holliday junction branch migration protein RuvA [Cerasicoccus arenae]GHB98961.1 Holliday junction ATP-dependent DNA helicase RuvA [Cerasicoccus arenae]
MIAYLQGKVADATPLTAIIDVNGIGYALTIPVTTAEKLPPVGQQTKIWTVAVYREDSASLYGFATIDERDFFRLLVEKVSGIGPKIAISILSKLSVAMLQQAIASGDVGLLAKCPGIGKKTAERLVVELKDKVGALGGSNIANADNTGVSPSSVAPLSIQDAVAALVALGYKLPDADKSVRKAAQTRPDATTEELIRAALN